MESHWYKEGGTMLAQSIILSPIICSNILISWSELAIDRPLSLRSHVLKYVSTLYLTASTYLLTHTPVFQLKRSPRTSRTHKPPSLKPLPKLPKQPRPEPRPPTTSVRSCVLGVIPELFEDDKDDPYSHPNYLYSPRIPHSPLSPPPCPARSPKHAKHTKRAKRAARPPPPALESRREDVEARLSAYEFSFPLDEGSYTDASTPTSYCTPYTPGSVPYTPTLCLPSPSPRASSAPAPSRATEPNSSRPLGAIADNGEEVRVDLELEFDLDLEQLQNLGSADDDGFYLPISAAVPHTPRASSPDSTSSSARSATRTHAPPPPPPPSASDPFRLTLSDSLSLAFPHPPRPSLPVAYYYYQQHSSPPNNNPHPSNPNFYPNNNLHPNTNANPMPKPSPSMSPTPTASPYSSPSSHGSDLPITPITSDDDDEPLRTPLTAKPNPILKNRNGGVRSHHHHRVQVASDLESVHGEACAAVVPDEEKGLAGLDARVGAGEEDEDGDGSDTDSLNDYYTQLFSGILTLHSPPSRSRSSSPHPDPDTQPHIAPARPDSIFLPTTTSTKMANREAAVVLLPSTALDPTFPRRSRLTVVSSGGGVHSAPAAPQVRWKEVGRPAPRISIPFDMGVEDDRGRAGEVRAEEQQVEPEEEEDTPSIYSQDGPDTSPTPSHVDLAEYDIYHDPEMPLGLPASLPTSPVDPDEAEEGFSMKGPVSAPARGRAAPPGLPLGIIPEREVSSMMMMMEPAVPETPTVQMYSSSHCAQGSYARYQAPYTTNGNYCAQKQYNCSDNDPYYATAGNEMQSQQHYERVLRSRWSSSTLSTLRSDSGEKKESSSRTSSRLRFHFGSSSKKGSSKHASSSSVASSSNSSSSTVTGRRSMSPQRPPAFQQMSPMSPFFPFPIMEGPRSPNGYILPVSPSPTRKEFTGQLRRRESHDSHRWSSSIASGVSGVWGLRRSKSSTSSTSTRSGGSHTSRSSRSSECESCESGGLRRKAIPVEMFIKC